MKKRVTIKDVAAEARVAYQTVSKVINGQAQVLPETEARIWAAAHALGYRPNHSARSLRAQRSQMIGYSWEPSRPDEANHILDLFLTSMVAEAEAAGYHLLPFPFRDGEGLVDTYRELIEAGRVDGFVLSSVNYADPRVAYLQEHQVPFVAFGRTAADPDHPYVDVDGAAGLQAATAHLIESGHHGIAALAWPAGSRVGDDRLSGYQAAMNAAGLPVDPGWIARGEGSYAFGRLATERWLAFRSDERPTAIVALNDAAAVGALHALAGLGLAAGRDVAVVGFDDAPLARFMTPPLSSLRQPLQAAGRKCVEILVGLMAGQPPAETQVLLPPRLILRGTT